MNLYILRHAKAGERSARFPDDSKRPLTPDGEKEMFRVAKGMLAMELSFGLILSSPFVRAKRTAEIVAEVFKSNKLRLSKNLACRADARDLIHELNDDYPLLKNILLVGHEPYLSQLISRLIASDERLSLHFKKAGLCKLTVGELRFGRCAAMEWLLTPKQLTILGKKS
ncbi:MAG: phosphohistidine phosphatase SixA [Verrucomicrobiota bacterium]